jgi:hypothetical protein
MNTNKILQYRILHYAEFAPTELDQLNTATELVPLRHRRFAAFVFCRCCLSPSWPAARRCCGPENASRDGISGSRPQIRRPQIRRHLRHEPLSTKYSRQST